MKTKRLEVRILKRSDYTAWKKAKSAQAPMKNRFDTSPPALADLTKSKFYEILKRHKKNQDKDYSFVYGVFFKSALIGTVSLGAISRGVIQSAAIGYGIFNNHWGKGYGTEAVGALLDIAFKEQKLHRVIAGIEPGNARSLKIVRKFGFRREGIAKRSVLIRGQWQDLIQYALTCEEYGVIWQG